ncbi:MAG TPA: L,D-transpeptidase family protein [Acidimicrobiales bacterium]|nr:L,D-transpeptidase family protein [Acidimicrobiales bacterium]
MRAIRWNGRPGRRRVAGAVAATLAMTLAMAGLGGCGDGTETGTAPRRSGTTATTAPATTAPPTTAPPATPEPTTPPPAPPTTAPPAPPASDVLRRGASGAAVSDLEARLAELGYWTGAVDGTFDSETHHAVVALQKAAGIGRDGVVGPETRAALDRGDRPGARSASGRVVEIDLANQLLFVVGDGQVEAVFDTSTGSRPGTTPAGKWQVTRQIDGLRRSPLGLLYRPKYFYEGVAVHGYTSVPPYPASHGCVRVTYPAMDHIWQQGQMPVGTPVWVY